MLLKNSNTRFFDIYLFNNLFFDIWRVGDIKKRFWIIILLSIFSVHTVFFINDICFARDNVKENDAFR